MKQYKKTIKNSILGLVIGDTLGLSVEIERKDKKYNVFMKPDKNSTNRKPTAIWSDDTSLMLCLIDTMINGYCKDDYYQNVMNWYYKGKFSLIRCEYSYPQNIVNYNQILFYDNQEVATNDCYKCIMRCLPLIFDNEKKLNFERLKEICRLTHTDTITDIATYFYVSLGKSLFLNESLNIINACNKIIIETGIFFYNEPVALNKFERIFHDIQSLNIEDIKNTGDTVGILEAVIWCLLTTNSYKEAILKAISLEYNIDIISALVGGIAGLYYSNKTIFKDFVLPFKWTNMISERQELNNIINKFTSEITIEYIN